MATCAYASASSSVKASLTPHHHPPHFTPIEEGNEDEEFSQGRNSSKATPASDSLSRRDSGSKHQSSSTPSRSDSRGSSRRRPEHDVNAGVLCSKCRPSNRDKNKISIVPLENNGSIASPNGIFRSILASLSLRRSPRLSSSEGRGDGGGAAESEENWKMVASELSNKLIEATRKRDEAILEASKLKHSLTKLEIYCQRMKSELEICSNCGDQEQPNSPPRRLNYHRISVGDGDKVIENFVVVVSEARSTVRILSRALALQLRQMGPRIYDRVASLLQPYDIKISHSRNSRALLFYMEALLSAAFFQDFESVGFQKSAPNQVLNPIDRCEANFAMFSQLQGLTWEAVLDKGTKHFSEDFSRFCDRKMNEIVAMLGWNRAWAEPLLQAFFGASKAVWLVHLLANSVHPGLPIFRVDKGAGFDPVYMEDLGADKAKKLVPNMVRIMVTPGFYVYNNVVKCKVLCRYYNNNNNNNGANGGDYSSNDKGIATSPS